MRIKPEYSIDYELDDITIVRLLPDGTKEELSPIGASAAMAFEGLQHGLSRGEIVDSIVNEFTGVSPELVAEELDALAALLVSLGYAEE